MVKPDGCRCEGEHKNPYCFVTPRREPSIASRMAELCISHGSSDEAVHKLLDMYAQLVDETNQDRVELDEQRRIAAGYRACTTCGQSSFYRPNEDEALCGDCTQARLVAYKSAFENLCARIDRDGGHAQEGKTLEENLKRCDVRVADLNVICDYWAARVSREGEP